MEAEEKFYNFLKDKLSDDDYKTACKLYAEVFSELTRVTGEMFEQANEIFVEKRQLKVWKWLFGKLRIKRFI